MGDIRKASNLKFWTGNRTYMEPANDKRFGPRIIEAYRFGRHYYLTQAIVHMLTDFECPLSYNDGASQRAFESGFGLEISDCVQVVREMSRG